jgi:hypothetical protein
MSLQFDLCKIRNKLIHTTVNKSHNDIKIAWFANKIGPNFQSTNNILFIINMSSNEDRYDRKVICHRFSVELYEISEWNYLI